MAAGSGWSSGSGPISVDAQTAAKVAAGLKAAPREMRRELRRANATTAKAAQKWTRAAAMSGTPAERRHASAITGVGTSTAALIRINTRSQKNKGANPVFWGSDRTSGWNRYSYTRPKPGQKVRLRRQSSGARRQFRPAIGFAWRPATLGEGPYAINRALAIHLDDIGEIYMLGQLRALARAFPS